MSEYIERMKQEHKDLKQKIDALNGFVHGNAIFKDMCDLEQARMIKQSGFMESYLSVLDSRIWCASSE